MAEWRLLAGDCRESLATLPARSVQTCVTSPPYFGLRDYGHHGQIGAEHNLLDYVVALCHVFREVRRVLRDDGTLWLNLGDSYDKDKSLMGVPWKVAQRLRQDGWLVRMDIIWSKPDPMPESVTDRPTKAHEYLFLLSKQRRYVYDADVIREEPSDNPGGAAFYARKGLPMPARSDERKNGAGRRDGPETSGFAVRPPDYSQGRNRRSVWTVATQPFPGAHFATFPPKLVEPCILAGARPGDIVLDPFAGSGTTGMVALRHGRSFVGCELNPEYVELARDRIIADSPLLNTHAEAA